MPSAWLLYPVISAPMPFQMALDEILFRQMVNSVSPREELKPVLRFYYASEPWISVGYAYAGWKDADSKSQAVSASLPLDIPVCRRITGGGQVLHGRDLMFTLMAPKAADESFGSVRDSYAKIHECVKAAIEETGRKPSFYNEEDLPRGKDCFRFPIASDLSLGGEKIAGGGQKRSLGILMHQESIQMKSLGDPEDLKDLIEKKFETLFNARLEPAPFWPELFIKAETLGDERYHLRVSIEKA